MSGAENDQPSLKVPSTRLNGGDMPPENATLIQQPLKVASVINSSDDF